MLHQSAVEVPTTVAYTFGTADARHGASFCPEMYFVRHEDKCQYAAGYESITGPTFATAQFTDAEIVAEAEDLEEDMLDREYHARGMW
jgi:hypothetical protein